MQSTCLPTCLISLSLTTSLPLSHLYYPISLFVSLSLSLTTSLPLSHLYYPISLCVSVSLSLSHNFSTSLSSVLSNLSVCLCLSLSLLSYHNHILFLPLSLSCLIIIISYSLPPSLSLSKLFVWKFLCSMYKFSCTNFTQLFMRMMIMIA